MEGDAIAERFRSDNAPQFNKQEKLRGLEKGLRAGSCDRFAARASPSANPTPSARAHSRFGLSCALYNRYNCEKMVLIVLTQRHGGTKAQSDL